MQGSVEINSVKWVLKELQPMLKDVQRALEEVAEHTDQLSNLEPQVQTLLQVQGTLQLIELHGAAVFAEEMVHVTQALLKGKAGPEREAALETLMRAALQLPDYLERVQAGSRDVPMALLPILNELRQARKAPNFAERQLFFPDVSLVPVAEETDSIVKGIRLQTVARALRRRYQKNLAAWLKDTPNRQHLQSIDKVVGDLEAASVELNGRRVWFIFRALVQSVEDGSLDADALKPFVGKIDVLLRALLHEGEHQFNNKVSFELLKDMLYQVAHSACTSRRMNEVRATYQLARLLPSSQEIDMARESLAGPNLELLEIVNTSIKEDISQIKDAIEIYVHGSSKDTTQLQPLEALLTRVIDTAGMLGIEKVKTLLSSQVPLVQKAMQQSAEVPATLLMQIAGILLQAEEALDEYVSLRTDLVGTSVKGNNKAPDFAIAALPGPEFQALLSAVIREALGDLAKVREATLVYLADSEKTHALESVVQYLDEVRGAMFMLPLEKVIPLLEGLASYLRLLCIQNHHLPDETEQNQIADIVATIEYYLEAVELGRGDMSHILDAGEVALESLQSKMSGYKSEPVDVHEEPLALQVDDLESIEINQTVESDAVIETDSNEFIDLFEEDEIEQEPPESLPEVVEINESLAIISEDVDEEILGIFLEEAVGELEQISRSINEWETDTENEEAQARIRRAFHTLKGSGRVIGAELIGEFSWSMESLMNQVVAKRVKPNRAVFELLNESVGVLPQLIEQLRGNPEPIDNIHELIAQAYALATGTEIIPEDTISGLSAGQDLSENALISDDHIELQGLEISQPDMEIELDLDEDKKKDSLTSVYNEESLDFHPVTIEPPQLQSMELPSIQAGDLQALREEKQSLEVDVMPEPSASELGAMAELDALAEDTVDMVSEEIALESISDDELEVDLNADEELPVLIIDEPAAESIEEAKPLTDYTQTVEFAVDSSLEQPVIDPLLLEIFTNEAEVHLDTLQTLLDSATEQNNTLKVTDELMRALHTLHGSAQTAEIEEVAVLSGSLEKIVKIKQELGQFIAAEETVLLRECLLAMKQTLVWFAGSGQKPRNIRQLSSQLRVFHKKVEGENTGPEAQDQELLDIFIEEGDELLEASDSLLGQWRARPMDRGIVGELQRQLHTLKGGARMASFKAIADLAHGLETRVVKIADKNIPPDDAAFELMHEAVDALTHMLGQARHRQPIARADWLVDELVSGSSHREVVEVTDTALVSNETEGPEAGASIGHNSLPVISKADVTQEAIIETSPAAPGMAAQELIRVRSELLDNLANYAGEVNIYHSRLGQQVNNYRFNLDELDGTVIRLRDQLRQMELETEAQILFRHEKENEAQVKDFDPLEMDRYSRIQELSRALAESVNDLDSIKGILGDITRDSETLLVQQSRVSTDLQEGLMRTRMVRFDRINTRLMRVVRQTAATLNKKAELFVEGGDLEIDRSIQERMIAPLEHMLRNAISHGIETPKERKAAGKNETGKIVINVKRDGGDIVITIQDDGAGINVDAVREKAIKQGLMAEDNLLSDTDVLKMILETGMSTAKEVTQISGRGVGMDVVAAEIKLLGGLLEIATEAGAGSLFTARLPLTLAVNQALLVEAAGDLYAIPLNTIIGITQVNSSTLQKHYVASAAPYIYADLNYEVKHLGTMLKIGHPRLTDAEEIWPLVMLRAGEHRIALHIEALAGRREIVIKTVGPQIATISGISGASILPDGRVVLILDFSAMMRAVDAFTPSAATAIEQDLAAANATDKSKAISVMVVDDSITIRKVTERMLVRHGISVLLAKDGVDAVAMLGDHIPDLILLDIEMPRMDGYEVATYVRNSEQLKEVPIIMITSRTGEKHRKRAAEIGVNQYLGKPYQEADLLEHINQIIGLDL